MISDDSSWSTISSRPTEMRDFTPALGGRVAVRSGDVWNIILMNFESEERSIMLQYGAASVLTIGLSMIASFSMVF